MTFTVRIGSRPVTHFLLNTTQLLGNGGSSKIQQEIAVDDSLYVDSVLALEEEGEWQVVLVVGGLQQLTYYSFQVAAVSAVGEGEYSAPSKPSALGKSLNYPTKVLQLLIVVCLLCFVDCYHYLWTEDGKEDEQFLYTNML